MALNISAISAASSSIPSPVVTSSGSTSAPVATDTLTASWSNSGGLTGAITYQWKTSATAPSGTNSRWISNSANAGGTSTNSTYILANANIPGPTVYIYCILTRGGCSVASNFVGPYTTGTNGTQQA